MITSYITHDEAMIKSFMRDPEYAEELLKDVLTDGNDYEIQRVQSWYDEAKARSRSNALNLSYRNRVTVNAKLATAGAMA